MSARPHTMQAPMKSGFPFDVVRAREAAAYCLDRVPEHARTRFHLLKLLYLAEREAFARSGRPICGGWYVAMKDGPVMSEVYECMKGGADLAYQSEWDPYIASVADFGLQVRDEPPRKRLSRADREILDRVVRDHGQKTWKQLWEFVHSPANVPEYRDPVVRGRKRADIQLGELLSGVGREEAAVEAILADAAALRRHRQLLGS